MRARCTGNGNVFCASGPGERSQPVVFGQKYEGKAGKYFRSFLRESWYKFQSFRFSGGGEDGVETHESSLCKLAAQGLPEPLGIHHRRAGAACRRSCLKSTVVCRVRLDHLVDQQRPSVDRDFLLIGFRQKARAHTPIKGLIKYSQPLDQDGALTACNEVQATMIQTSDRAGAAYSPSRILCSFDRRPAGLIEDG